MKATEGLKPAQEGNDEDFIGCVVRSKGFPDTNDMERENTSAGKDID